MQTFENVLQNPDGRPGEKWTHTPWMRGEEFRLKRQVKRAEKKATSRWNAGRIQSVSLEAFGTPDAVEQTADEEPSYAPDAPLGSFVEMRR